MDGKNLLNRYVATRNELDPATPEQIAGVDSFVETFLQEAIPEPTGESVASWRLANGVVVEVSSALIPEFWPDTEGKQVNHTVAQHTVTFRRRLNEEHQVPGEEQFTEISYDISLPTEGSNALPQASRRSGIVDLQQTYKYNLHHAAAEDEGEMTKEDFLGLFDELDDDGDMDYEEPPEDQAITQGDLALLEAVLSQGAQFDQDPFQTLGNGELSGDEVSDVDVAARLSTSLDHVAANGRIDYRRSRTVSIPVDTPDYTVSLTVIKDESELGPLAGQEPTQAYPDWIVQVAIKPANSPIADLMTLEKTATGDVKSDRSAVILDLQERTRLMTEDPMAYMAHMADTAAREKEKAIRTSSGLDAATSGELAWFQQVTELAG